MTCSQDDPRSLRRREDQRFLTGTGRYLDDQPDRGELHAAVLRSPHAHARILSIGTSSAADTAGVLGIYTAADLDGLNPLPCSIKVETLEPLIVPSRFPLARDRVRHVGDVVAFVVAESRSAAREACEQIIVHYEILPCATELRNALDPGAAEIWPEAPGNLAFRFERGDRRAVTEAFASAAHLVECSLVNNRVVAAAIEPRGAVGRFEPATGVYKLAISGASVHAIRRELAEGVFGLPPDKIEVSTPDVGGGFGMKNVTYPEYALVLWAARLLGQPVRWTADRLDEFSNGVHGRDNITMARLALDAEGRFLALAVETLGNLGAYVSSLGPGSSTNAPSTAMGGLYHFPAMMMDVRGVFTNTAPIDAYRGAGKPEANYLLERLIDTAAQQLAMDPVELRLRNFIRQFPYRSAFGTVIDCGAFAGNLERVLLAADRAGFPARKTEAEKRGKLRGLGVGCFLETSRGSTQ